MIQGAVLNEEERKPQSPLYTNSTAHENKVGFPKNKRRRYNNDYSIGDTRCQLEENNQRSSPVRRRSSPVRRRVTKVQS